MADTYIKIGENNNALESLDNAVVVAVRLKPEDKAIAFVFISDLFAKSGNWRQARNAADKTGNDISRTIALAKLLQLWAAS
jgi:hypothetical protein